MRRRYRFLIPMLSAFLFSGHADADVKFVLYTQNLLHFGWGNVQKNAEKCKAIEKSAETADIILIQELMVNNYKTTCPSGLPGFEFKAYGPEGNVYKEYYGFLWRTKPSDKGVSVQYLKKRMIGKDNTYIRNPYALAFEVKNTNTKSEGPKSETIIIGNIHSIYGKTVGDRQREAASAGTYFDFLKSPERKIKGKTTPEDGWPVIIGGDWNIPVRKENATAPDKGFEWVKASDNIKAIPESRPTSLSTKGKPSSPYDHFIYTSNKLELGEYKLNPEDTHSVTNEYWRNNISDHMGVFVNVEVLK